jgi:hypothetical protein
MESDNERTVHFISETGSVHYYINDAVLALFMDRVGIKCRTVKKFTGFMRRFIFNYILRI